MIVTMLRSSKGTCIADLCKATGWQAHSVRGAISGAIKKRLKIKITSATWPLKRVDLANKTAKKSGVAPKTILKALKDTGAIILDSDTQLTNVPKEAWSYRLGNRSALEWVLDQYKEKTPKDPTIREKFNTYKFADYKEHVIDLLKRVTRVSVETQKIIEEMKAAKDAR